MSGREMVKVYSEVQAGMPALPDVFVLGRLACPAGRW